MEEILGSIMTAEEYAEVRHTAPYVFELSDGDKTIYYFGTKHLSNPEDPVFNDIENDFKKVDPDIVVIEGVSVGNLEKFNKDMPLKTNEEIIKNMGESGFVIKLALKKGIEWICPEPSDAVLYEHLLEVGFSKDEVFAWSVFHLLPQYSRGIERQGFQGYMKGFTRRFQQMTNWKDFDYLYEHAIQIGEKVLGRKIDVENEPNSIDFVDPIPWPGKKDSQTVLNLVNRESSRFRDREIVKGIVRLKEKYKKIFVVYGASHAVVQESALKKAFINNN